ncbi:hypothetical protein [Microbacterium sp.]|uniref:hypothetical protein n=1 Tax=Microbacterium sp. TaxID=51671 RepID=UPI003A8E5F84
MLGEKLHLYGDAVTTFCGLPRHDGMLVRPVIRDFTEITCGLCIRLVYVEIERRRAERFPRRRR